MSSIPRFVILHAGEEGKVLELNFFMKFLITMAGRAFVKFDYRLTRGPGIGLETYYRSSDHKETFEAINYVARDSSIENPKERFRYRFQGDYSRSLFNDTVSS